MSLNAESVNHDPSSILARMRAEVSAIVAEAPRVWDECLRQAKDVSDPARPLVITGCGDSYYAGLGVRSALEEMRTGEVAVLPAMEVTSFPGTLLRKADLVAVSVSGKVGRTIDAVEAHKLRGGSTLSVTAFADSDIGTTADHVISTGVRGTPGPVPGTANYMASMLGLLAIGAANQPEWREQIDSALEALPRFLPLASEFASSSASLLADPVFAVGSGPEWGTANFLVAKLLEAAAVVGVAQDLEEWAHEQYFVTRPGRAVVVFGNEEPSRGGALKVVDMAHSIGAEVIAVGSDLRSPSSVQVLEPPKVFRGLTPLIAWLPAALLALEFAEQNNRYPFGIDTPQRMETVDRNIYVPSPARA